MSEPPAARTDMVALQQRLQHEFNNPALLQQALTHRSHSAEHNERLEFLGDSVLNLAVAHLLFERMSHVPEGELSRMRSNLARTRDKSPSGRLASCAYNRFATDRLSTESPKNSKRSLWSALKLRCVTACCNKPVWRKA
jgi:dsRNA-specific ribonuclease